MLAPIETKRFHTDLGVTPIPQLQSDESYYKQTFLKKKIWSITDLEY